MADPTTTAEKRPDLSDEVVEKVTALATAGFGLVAALAWNSLIQKAFAHWFPPNEELLGLLLYALLVTAVAVLVTVWLARLSRRLKTLDDRLHDRVRRPRA